MIKGTCNVYSNPVSMHLHLMHLGFFHLEGIIIFRIICYLLSRIDFNLLYSIGEGTASSCTLLPMVSTFNPKIFSVRCAFNSRIWHIFSIGNSPTGTALFLIFLLSMQNVYQFVLLIKFNIALTNEWELNIINHWGVEVNSLSSILNGPTSIGKVSFTISYLSIITINVFICILEPGLWSFYFLCYSFRVILWLFMVYICIVLLMLGAHPPYVPFLPAGITGARPLLYHHCQPHLFSQFYHFCYLV